MIRVSNKRKKLIIFSVAITAAVGMGLHANVIKLPITNTIYYQWGPEVGSYEGTMKAVSNVFVGKVIKQTGSKARFEFPETQFAVEVLQNIKGDLQGEVIVSQEGGYRDGVLYRSSEDITVSIDEPVRGKDDGLMKEGETYLFVTRYSEMGKWYDSYSHPYGTKLLSRNKDLKGDALRALYEKDEKYVKLKESYEKGLAQNVGGKDGAKDDEESSEQGAME